MNKLQELTNRKEKFVGKIAVMNLQKLMNILLWRAFVVVQA